MLTVYALNTKKSGRVLLIHCMRDIEDLTEYAVEEGISLIKTYSPAIKIDVMKFNIRKISLKTYLNRGKILQVQEYINNYNTDFIFWNHNIQYRHQRALEDELKIKIFDRIKIILDIFQARATSAEEKLRTALAYKEYERTKIVHAWSHLERQRGGMSKTGGPGEKQIELDKRMIDQRIITYKKKLKKIEVSRAVQRNKRVSNNIKTIAIVGYTNVGKTTLFNLLTKSQDLAEDKLFATLDPHTRRAFFHNLGIILISDTVGFIRNFPPSLKNAFASTLEEIKYAHLILHVRDARMPLENKYAQNIKNTLHDLLNHSKAIPTINIWNKNDTNNDCDNKNDLLNENEQYEKDNIKISCKTGYGIDRLKTAIHSILASCGQCDSAQ